MATPITTDAAAQSGSPELVKSLGPFDATTIVMGSMIGSGIFIVAAVAVAFGKFLGVFFPWISAQNSLLDLGAVTVPLWGHTVRLAVSSQQLVALASLMFLAVVNIFGLRTGALLQNIFTTLKVAAL